MYVCDDIAGVGCDHAVCVPPGPVASIFWLDKELGSDVYLDGKEGGSRRIGGLSAAGSRGTRFDIHLVRVTHFSAS